jgi:branched-chain amino acid transport system ATP-binding protein
VKPAILETSGLTVHFGGVAALSDVDFRLEEGELRCLIGPNGAGKSTFFKCLTGQYQPTRGTVAFRGKNLRGCSGYQIARLGVGIKMQVPSVFDGLSVAENAWIASARICSGSLAVENARAAMERMGVAHLATMLLGNLAHGQRQLVELAMVLVSDPDLILLDEPAAGMTDSEVDRLVRLIKDLNQRHTLIIVEHDMHFIRRIATHVTVFNQGRILIEGDVGYVLGNQTVRDIYLGSEAP